MKYPYCPLVDGASEGAEKLKRRILMLNFEFPPIGGGAANANYYLLKEFSKRPDLEIDLVTSTPNSQPEREQFSKNIKIYKLNVKKKSLHFWRMSEVIMWLWKAYWLSRELTETKKYTLCHCWFGWPAGIIGYLLRKKLPYIVALRGSDVPGYSERLKKLDIILFRYLSMLIWKNAEALTALSHRLRELAEETYNKKRIQVIYNGVEITEFKPDPNMSESFSELKLLFVGRLIKRKGVIYLLKAFKHLCDDHKGCRLTIAGNGPEKKSLSSYCLREGIATKVTFCGAVKNNLIDNVYQKTRIFVLPSIEEAQSNVILEAMASGLPVITTDTGAAELVDGNGFVVEKRNPKQLKEAVEKYVANPELLKKHGQRSRQIAEKLSWKNTARSYFAIYKSIK